MATHKVTFVTDGHSVTLDVPAETYLLDAGVQAGLDLPYMCLQGWCTTCAAKLLEGKVDQSESLRYYPQDEAAGYILPCSGRALSDVRMVTHQKEPMRAQRRALGLPAPRG
jgi:ferredoxin